MSAILCMRLILPQSLTHTEGTNNFSCAKQQDIRILQQT